ncbi:hypothetical protein ACU8NH_04065 [Rhizobium leguminosarum]|jgi:hypothetical protein|uniref:Uncharacterized protein n=1 Tax=Rhizobium leguminosarum TaxID=384 RepID=A0A444HQS9_RHILE|nr:hypothetical protein [Rhizobium leguminosarum]MDH6659664.1 hypothetical protein [Rhizobium sophorae]ASS54057.1 hypothetical protein CHR56_05395 [Rhizobium leguminosarum bv. viciae]AVC48676.1 hypothetical protein RLV_3513 [Rhizobium leguminosarum bv. viciae]MBB4333130.1 hypothetical protein [Rhizobium leguminosarum]MBB4344552.1 hypothetical protein [Rhizobium leguminosarum]
MQHIRNIETEESKRDARWNAARTTHDCRAYMANEAQRMGALGFAYLRRPEHAIRGPSWLRGAAAGVEEHYRYAREIMGITDTDQLYA